jgi:predicted ATPase with chaperone activity
MCSSRTMAHRGVLFLDERREPHNRMLSHGRQE